MARHLNKVFLIGNLTDDPDLRYTPNDTAVADFSLALNSSYQDSNGEWQQETDYVDITVWGNQAENASQYLEKGSKTFLEGRLDHQTWETDSGDRRSKLEVTASNLIFLDAPQGEGESELDEVVDNFDDFDVKGEADDSIPF